MNIEGLISFASVDEFNPTVQRLDAALEERRITPILRLDHAAAARGVGLHLTPVLLILFGNPKVGTSLMQINPTAGIDLPLKILIWEEPDRIVRVGYNDPAWVRARHKLPQSAEALTRIASLLEELATVASGHHQL